MIRGLGRLLPVMESQTGGCGFLGISATEGFENDSSFTMLSKKFKHQSYSRNMALFYSTPNIDRKLVNIHLISVFSSPDILLRLSVCPGTSRSLHCLHYWNVYRTQKRCSRRSRRSQPRCSRRSRRLQRPETSNEKCSKCVKEINGQAPSNIQSQTFASSPH